MAFNFQYILYIQEVRLDVNFPCKVRVNWKTSRDKLETAETP
jgi:hypothetical protein